MKKSHEETWVRFNDPDAGKFGVRSDAGRLVLDSDEQTTFADLDLASAAPEMARALLMRRRCTEPEGQCQQCSAAAERALKKAGVL